MIFTVSGDWPMLLGGPARSIAYIGLMIAAIVGVLVFWHLLFLVPLIMGLVATANVALPALRPPSMQVLPRSSRLRVVARST